jgi:outer membrane protein assembly factor BamB
VPFASPWTSPDLGGAVWGQPLVRDGLVIAATETNQVRALNESIGQTVWQASAGTPVPASGTGPHPPCGDISPYVGITSTPVIDPIGGSIVHELYAFNLANGNPVAGFPMSVEPPGDVPADQLQRPGLVLDNE